MLASGARRFRQTTCRSAGWGGLRALPLSAQPGLRQARPGHRPTAACLQSPGVLPGRNCLYVLFRRGKAGSEESNRAPTGKLLAAIFGAAGPHAALALDPGVGKLVP